MFNTDMVQAILDGRKTVTRRVIRYKYSNTEMKMRTDKYGARLIEIQKDIEGETHGRNPDGSTWHKLLPYIEKNPPYRKKDILYVRETWSTHYTGDSNGELVFCYKADGINLKSECLPGERNRWYPSIHMPKEAARIWLKVIDMRIERLQDITEKQAEAEGAIDNRGFIHSYANEYDVIHSGREHFEKIWDSTIRKSDRTLYGWGANPWVWVVNFERCERPEVV